MIPPLTRGYGTDFSKWDRGLSTGILLVFTAEMRKLLGAAGQQRRRHGFVRVNATAGTALADGKVVDFYELLNVSVHACCIAYWSWEHSYRYTSFKFSSDQSSPWDMARPARAACTCGAEMFLQTSLFTAIARA